MKCPAIDHAIQHTREMVPSGWSPPHGEWYCRGCKKYFSDDGEEMPKPEEKEAPSGLIIDDMTQEELQEYFYGGM